MACFAKGFSDPSEKVVPTSLAQMFSYAGTLYDGNHVALAKWLQDKYGIYPAFAGIGYSVKDSYSIDKPADDIAGDSGEVGVVGVHR